MHRRLMVCCVCLMAALIGCQDQSRPDPAPAKDKPAQEGAQAEPKVPKRTKTPLPVLDFEPGPALKPAPELLTWLKAQGEADKTIKIPIALAWGDHRLSIKRAVIGLEPAAVDDPEAIELDYDDGALGISLMTHLQHTCPKEGHCVIWVEGTWGSLLPMPGADPNANVIAVRRFVGPAKPDDKAHVWVVK